MQVHALFLMCHYIISHVRYIYVFNETIMLQQVC